MSERNPYREQVAAAIRATAIHSPTEYSWFGKRSDPYPRRLARALTARSARTLLLFDLLRQLYENFYVPGGATASGDEDPPLFEVEREDFLAELAASAPRGHCETNGWRPRLIRRNQVVLRRGGLELWARPQDCFNGNGPLARRSRVSVRIPRQAPYLSPGFFFVLGRIPWPASPGPLVRWYWNVTAEGALRLLRTATEVLDCAGVSFQLKVANHPLRFSRCDAGVLYLRFKDCESAQHLIAKIFAEVAPFLKEGTPALTRQVAPGLGWAEDPAADDSTMHLNSFGTHRCYLIADGLIRAHERGKASLEERLEMVEARFKKDGVRVDEPYRNFRLDRRCNLDALAARLSRPRVASRSLETSHSLVATAHNIAERIAGEAVWHEDRCNWLGAGRATVRPGVAPEQASYASLGPDLYSGTAGVALFLGEVCRAGAPSLRPTALGAIRHALACSNSMPKTKRLPLYTGSAGIAYAAARLAALLEQPELMEQAARLAGMMLREGPEPEGFDLLSGKAGAILGLLSLRSVLPDSQLLPSAINLGDSLLHSAEWQGDACSWKSVNSYSNLTGLAHGTAGVALALLELYAATREARFRKTAGGAFEYERRCFDPSARNWPDYRREPKQRRNKTRAFANSWADGTPGIVLARLRAFQILGDERYKQEAAVAISTVGQSIRQWQRSHAGNWSLGEGLAGNCEVLFSAGEVFGGEYSADRALLIEALQQAAQAYAGRQWPCATAGENPSLMQGFAGAGYLCLRASTKIPSVLAFTVRERGLAESGYRPRPGTSGRNRSR